MPGWEIRIERLSVQKRAENGRVRTVGRYQIFHDGVARSGPGMSGCTAESRGRGANTPENNGRRIAAGTYPLATQDGGQYATIGYAASEVYAPSVRRPGIELRHTGNRTEILIHPGTGFLASVGCINLCTSLPDASEMIDYIHSRKRVIAVIDDLAAFLGDDFPNRDGRAIPRAFAVITGEP